MSIFKCQLGLYTDFYELTMAQGYFFNGKKDDRVVFDYFYRTNPYKGGFTVFAGLYDLIDALKHFSFDQGDITYLKSLGLNDKFLEYLRSFSFCGDIYSVKEGEIIFPNEPVLRVEGNIIECQLIESILLNILNFQSLIATKAYRIKMVSGGTVFSDFGLRRAQGFGALHASRAAIIGGATSTSNALAGKQYNIPVTGTMAHSWIQSFDSELEAFRSFASANPENTILLVDTFNTLKSGLPNAIQLAREMESRNQRLKAIRLDSGDLAYLSKKARIMLDNAGFNYVKIVASNQLNEYVIKSLLKDQDAPIDAFGIGTELITGKSDAALDGVYKLAELNGKPKMKFSENIEKVTLPGRKKLVRYFDKDGKFYRDGILGMDEVPEEITDLYHPIYPEKNSQVSGLKAENLLKKVVSGGKIKLLQESPKKIHGYLEKRAILIAQEHKRYISPHIYKVGISKRLMETRNALTEKLKTLH